MYVALVVQKIVYPCVLQMLILRKLLLPNSTSSNLLCFVVF